MAESESVALWLARVTLMDPYPADIFTELTPEEVKICVAALQASGVRNASDRLHASWARHLYRVAKHVEERQREE